MEWRLPLSARWPGEPTDRATEPARTDCLAGDILITRQNCAEEIFLRPPLHSSQLDNVLSTCKHPIIINLSPHCPHTRADGWRRTPAIAGQQKMSRGGQITSSFGSAQLIWHISRPHTDTSSEELENPSLFA